QLPGGRDISNPEHRAYIASVWGIKPEELPQVGGDCYGMMRKIDAGEIKGLISICFNRLLSLPDYAFFRRERVKLACYAVIEFFMSETARFADIVLPG